MQPDLVVRAAHVVLPDGVRKASVHIARGKVDRVAAYEDVPTGVVIEEIDGAWLIPGLVDTHVHINEPGRTEWEGFETATRAAASGGVTSIVDMPLNSIPATISEAALQAKRVAAQGKCYVNVGFCGGLVPGNIDELRELRNSGVLAFKCFMSESGVSEFAYVKTDDLDIGLRTLGEMGAPLLVHAEVSGPIDAALRAQHNLSESELRRYIHYLESRPRAAENEAVDTVIRLSTKYGARAHIVHLSSADALLSIRDAKGKSVPISAETCPHYLSFAAEDIPDGATAFKCAPPIRERANQSRLWSGLADELIEQVVTDHSPATSSLKCADSGDFMKAWGGISSLQIGLSAVWTEARKRGIPFADVVRWMSERPAKLVGLNRRKGGIFADADADLALVVPEASWVVEPLALEHRNKLTPYASRKLYGVVKRTFLGGTKIFDHGQILGKPRGVELRP